MLVQEYAPAGEGSLSRERAGGCLIGFIGFIFVAGSSSNKVNCVHLGTETMVKDFLISNKSKY